MTRFVDDDGTAGPRGCGGGLSVTTSIQATVDASIWTDNLGDDASPADICTAPI